MNKTGTRTYSLEQFETKWLIKKLKEHHRKSGLSQRKWIASIGFPKKAPHVTQLFQGQHGIQFWQAVRFANAIEADLSELQ